MPVFSESRKAAVDRTLKMVGTVSGSPDVQSFSNCLRWCGSGGVGGSVWAEHPTDSLSSFIEYGLISRRLGMSL